MSVLLRRVQLARPALRVLMALPGPLARTAQRGRRAQREQRALLALRVLKVLRARIRLFPARQGLRAWGLLARQVRILRFRGLRGLLALPGRRVLPEWLGLPGHRGLRERKARPELG